MRPPLPPPPPLGPRAQWREAQHLRLAGACLYASAVLVASCYAAAFLIASAAMGLSSSKFPISSFSPSAALRSSLFSPRVLVAALLMSSAQALAVVAMGKAARACPPTGPKALSLVVPLFFGRRRRWLPSALSTSLSTADAALTRLALDGAASTRAGLALITACAASGWAIVPLFCWMTQKQQGSSSSSSSPFFLSTPPWAPTLGLLVGAAHAVIHLGFGEDVVLVPALRRARAFAVKRAAAESVRRAAALAAGAAAAVLFAARRKAAEASSPSLASAAVALLGAAVAAHALLVGAASVRAAFGERTQFVDSGISSSSALLSASSFRGGGAAATAAEAAVARANDGLVASIVEATTSKRDPSSIVLEASLFDLAVRADAAALAEAAAGSAGAWRRAALFADGVVGSESSSSSSGRRSDERSGAPFPAASPGRAWSAVVGGLCLSELAPALAAVGTALLPPPPSAAAAAGVPSTSGRGGSGAEAAATAAPLASSPPRWNEHPSAAATRAGGTGGGGASAALFSAAKRLTTAATSLLSSSLSSSKRPHLSSTTKTTTPPPAPLPPAVLKAKAAALLRQRWQHLALALRTLGALSAAAAAEDAAGVAQLAGRCKGGEGDDDSHLSSQFSFHAGTDLGSVLSALLSAAVAFGAAAEPGALPEWGGTAAKAGGGGGVGGGAAALAPPGLCKLAAALDDEDASYSSSSRSRSSRPPRRDAAASALADAALAAAHRAVSAYGKDARRAVLSAELACPVFGSGVSAAAVAALAEAVLTVRD